MDIAILSQQIVTFITPFLPYLVKVGEKATEEMGGKIGGAAWEQAKALWNKMHPKMDTKPTMQEVVQDLAESPDDPDLQAALRVQLKKLFADEPTLAAELSQFLSKSHLRSEMVVGNVLGGEVTSIKAKKISGGAELSSSVKSKDVEGGNVTGISVEDVEG